MEVSLEEDVLENRGVVPDIVDQFSSTHTHIHTPIQGLVKA